MKKEHLREIRFIYDEVEDLRDKIIKFENMRISPRNAVYGSERVQTSPKGDIQPSTIAAIDALLRTYNAKLKAYIKITTEFENALSKLSARESRLIRMHYLDGKTWAKIQEEEAMSERNLLRISKRATKKITSL